MVRAHRVSSHRVRNATALRTLRRVSMAVVLGVMIVMVVSSEGCLSAHHRSLRANRARIFGGGLRSGYSSFRRWRDRNTRDRCSGGGGVLLLVVEATHLARGVAGRWRWRSAGVSGEEGTAMGLGLDAALEPGRDSTASRRA
ncbi:hypothetical protein BC629DRAFT_642531 [Irpex lacteus]|nr:hypothetical protein BC629DRAFT_642531 [Irpex lacteus]